jgi:hypothetical protein
MINERCQAAYCCKSFLLLHINYHFDPPTSFALARLSSPAILIRFQQEWLLHYYYHHCIAAFHSGSGAISQSAEIFRISNLCMHAGKMTDIPGTVNTAKDFLGCKAPYFSHTKDRRHFIWISNERIQYQWRQLISGCPYLAHCAGLEGR